MGGPLLVAGIAGTAPQVGIVWLEDAGRAPWSVEEAAALALVGQALGRLLDDATCSAAPWVEQWDHAVRQQHLDRTAQVTGRLAHDFGNVLTSILGFTELCLAQQTAEKTPLNTYLNEIHRAAHNGALFTHQLRLLSRRQATSIGSTSVSSFLAGEEKRCRTVWGAGVSLRVVSNADLPPVALDSEQLRHAIGAILENAREAAASVPGGTVTVTTHLLNLTAADCRSLYGEARPGLHVEVRIADTGPGLGEGARKVFAEPFYSTRPRRRGFGLALAHGVLAAHHGGLQLQANPTGGTLARIVLPLAAGAATAAAKSRPAKGETVLVVDDDPLILHFVCTTVERAGYRVQRAANAAEALQSYTASAADLVLTDVAMPGMSGPDLARRLCKQDANVRVLFMSGNATDGFAGEEMAAHQFELLPKPFRPDALLRAVRSALDRKRTTPKPADDPAAALSSTAKP